MIKVFGATWCANCTHLKKDIENKGLEYEYFDVGTKDGLAEMHKYGLFKTLPVTVITVDEGELISVGRTETMSIINRMGSK